MPNQLKERKPINSSNNDNEERKQVIRVVVIFVLMTLFLLPTPYKGFLLLDYLLPELHFSTFSVNLSGILILILLILFFRSLISLNKLKENRGIVLLVLLFLLIPLAEKLGDGLVTSVYYLNTGVKSIQLIECQSNVQTIDNETVLNFEMTLSKYRNLKENTFVKIEFVNAEDHSYQIRPMDTINLGRNKRKNQSIALQYQVSNGTNKGIEVNYDDLKNLKYRVVFYNDFEEKAWGNYPFYDDMKNSAMIEIH